MIPSEKTLEDWVKRILGSKKYRQLGLNAYTVKSLFLQEAPKHKTEKLLLKTVKRKLHNIVAPYLGEPDYELLTYELNQVESATLESPTLRNFCRKTLLEHASTAERIPLLPDFYQRLFEATGQPSTILDLACGLNPLSFPWMDLPRTVQYFAYDIIQPRIDFINNFFVKIGMKPLAENRDILANPPTQHADIAFIFKEAHRFEKRDPGSNLAFWESIPAKVIAVSLPTRNLAGNLNLLEGHRQLILHNLPQGWLMNTIEYENEIIFLLRKGEVKIW